MILPHSLVIVVTGCPGHSPAIELSLSTAARRSALVLYETYASLHPGWTPREGDTGVVHCTTQGESCPA